MNKQITRLAVVGIVMIAALIVATTYWQTWAAAGLADRQDNAIERVAEFTIERGRIVTGNGTVLARNVPRKVGGKTLYFREYPQGKTFAHVTGYSTQVRSRAGLERSLNDYLTASNANLNTVVDRTLDRIRGATIQGNDVVVTIRPRAQRAAQQALGNRCGAVVALDPRTGAVLALASSPSYDPNLIEEDFRRAERAPNAECNQPAPLLNRATDGLYIPGSTFKVLTAASAIESGAYGLQSTFRDPGYCEEYGKRVYNYSDQGTPSGYGTVTLLQAIQYSINSVFCNIGKEIGAGTILRTSKEFGFYDKPPLDTPANERQASGLYRDGALWDPDEPASQVDPGRFAFGQERLQVTPIQMAMVAAGIANDGVVMKPFMVERVVAPNGTTVTTTKPDELGRAISSRTANAVTEGMKAAVRAGTSTRAQIAGIEVAGKTGTAETGRDGVNTVAFVAFAPAEAPTVAIAVFVEQQRSTGGQTAAPIAKTVMEALLGGGSNS